MDVYFILVLESYTVNVLYEYMLHCTMSVHGFDCGGVFGFQILTFRMAKPPKLNIASDSPDRARCQRMIMISY